MNAILKQKAPQRVLSCYKRRQPANSWQHCWKFVSSIYIVLESPCESSKCSFMVWFCWSINPQFQDHLLLDSLPSPHPVGLVVSCGSGVSWRRLPFVPTWGLLVKFFLGSLWLRCKFHIAWSEQSSSKSTNYWMFCAPLWTKWSAQQLQSNKNIPQNLQLPWSIACLFQDLLPNHPPPRPAANFWFPSELFVLDHHFLREWNSEGLLLISSSLPPNKAPEPPQKTGREWSKFWRRHGYIRIYTFLLPAKWVKIQRILPFLNSGPASLQGHKISKWSRLQGLEISKSCFYPLVN